MIVFEKPEYNIVLHKVGTGEQLNATDVAKDFEGETSTKDAAEAIKTKRYLEKPNVSAVASIKSTNIYPAKTLEKDDDAVNELFWSYF